MLGDGSQFGIDISYREQPSPDGLAQAFIIGEEFIGEDNVCLILGDNIFYGQHFTDKLVAAAQYNKGGTIFGYHVQNPQDFGVVEFDDEGHAREITEKPDRPKSNYAITGLYFYDNRVVEIAKSITPSARGELEITDVNQVYLDKQQLNVENLGRGAAWLDTGTHESLLEAASFIKTIETRQGLKIACLEEIAYRMGYIDAAQVEKLAEPLQKNGYGEYLLQILKDQNILLLIKL